MERVCNSREPSSTPVLLDKNLNVFEPVPKKRTLQHFENRGKAVWFISLASLQRSVPHSTSSIDLSEFAVLNPTNHQSKRGPAYDNELN